MLTGLIVLKSHCHFWRISCQINSCSVWLILWPTSIQETSLFGSIKVAIPCLLCTCKQVPEGWFSGWDSLNNKDTQIFDRNSTATPPFSALAPHYNLVRDIKSFPKLSYFLKSDKPVLRYCYLKENLTFAIVALVKIFNLDSTRFLSGYVFSRLTLH